MVLHKLPNVLVIMGALIALYGFVTRRTVIGRQIYAVGGNAKAASLSGIKTERLTFLTFVNMGVLAAVAGPGMVTSITAIGIFQIPTFVRVTRGSANAIWAREFVLAARAAGKGSFRITIEHVLPNILSILIVQATIQFALAILAEAALSYLGLGTQPPQPSWGRMLNDAQTLLFQSPMLAVYPGAAIAIAVLGLNLLGDGLRDLLDPRLAQER